MIKRIQILVILACVYSYGFGQNVFPTTGSVGIGTVNPKNELDINGNLSVHNSNGDLGIYLHSGTYTVGSGVRELFRVGQNSLITGGIFTISATRGNFVHTSQWAWSSSHNATGRGVLTQLSAGEYSNITVYLDVQSNGGVIISADWGDSQTYNISIQKMSGNKIDVSQVGSDWAVVGTNYIRRRVISTISNGIQSHNGIFSGNVGIGTTTPSSRLDIQEGSIRISTPGERIEWNSTNKFYNWIESDGIAGDNFMRIGVANTEYVRINQSGMVGFGTSNLTGLWQSNYVFSKSGNNGVSIESTTSNNSTLSFIDSRIGNPGYDSGGSIIYEHANDNLIFRTNGTEQFRITSAGQFGIGSTSVPNGYKMAIDGKLITEKVVVRNSGNWPDFVFDKNYELPELSEVEAFINSNNHLPEIPSAKEIEENGQDLGEMNRLLLKKVEELTLYMIKQNKELESQKKALSEQKAEISYLKELTKR